MSASDATRAAAAAARHTPPVLGASGYCICVVGARLANEWDELHPEVRDVLLELAQWSAQHGLPPPIATCLHRSKDENRAVYGRDKFSWHLVDCAADLRIKHYTPEQLGRVQDWVALRCTGLQPTGAGGDEARWELVFEPHGTGPHLHIARRCREWQAERWSP